MTPTHVWHRKIIQPILALLRQGITVQRITLTIACGITLGVFPVLGITTFLCAMVALALRLNQPAIQLVNYTVFPLQIILLLPFYRAGEWLFQAEPLLISAGDVAAMIETDVWKAVHFLWETTLRAIAVWLILGPAVTGVLYLVLKPIIRRLAFCNNPYAKGCP